MCVCVVFVLIVMGREFPPTSQGAGYCVGRRVINVCYMFLIIKLSKAWPKPCVDIYLFIDIDLCL